MGCLHLISKEKYNELVRLHRTKYEKKEAAWYLKYWATYSLCSNVEGHCLYREWDGKMKVVPTDETVFDIILEAHSKGGHAKGKMCLFQIQRKNILKYHFAY